MVKFIELILGWLGAILRLFGFGKKDDGPVDPVERWRPLVEKYFLPEDHEWAMRVIRCESGGNPDARNPTSGALGLFQHMPQYWNDRANAVGFAGFSARHAEANVAAAAYLYYEPNWGGPQHWVCK